jgi:GAF domain
VAEEKEKRIRNDEQTLARVLAAAYTVQEYNRELQEMKLGPKSNEQPKNASPASVIPTEARKQQETSASAEDHDSTLAKIVETQYEIQSRNLGLQQALQMVATRLTEITGAGGVGIALVEDKHVCYRAAAGSFALPAGTRVPLEKALCSDCLRTGEIVRSGGGGEEAGLDDPEWRGRGVRFAIAVPIFRDGGTAGSLELYYARVPAFRESDGDCGQLMSGLITEALSREAQLAPKTSPVSEPTALLDGVEKPPAHLSSAAITVPSPESAKNSVGPVAESADIFICKTCGHELVGEEQFCGKCGTARKPKSDSLTLQSKVAALWHMQEARRTSEPANFPDQSHEADDSEVARKLFRSEMRGMELAEEWKQPSSQENSDGLGDGEIAELTKPLSECDSVAPAAKAQEEETEEEGSSSTTSKKLEQLADWSSAANTREYLEHLAADKPVALLVRLWNTRRGDIYLALAVVLTAFVIRWEMSSSHSAAVNPSSTAAAQHRSAPDASLSFFDRVLISLGLAEAPEPADYKGNPEVRVWVDLRTALYYCPGSELYGKTDKGKFTSQRDAQLDQFEPAYRRACD